MGDDLSGRRERRGKRGADASGSLTAVREVAREKYREAATRQAARRRAPSRARYNEVARRLRNPLSDTPVPGRITMALNLANLWGPEVDEACGVAEPTVDLWESGDVVPTREQVRKLAFITGMKTAFFYLPAPLPVDGLFVCGYADIEGEPTPEVHPAEAATLF